MSSPLASRRIGSGTPNIMSSSISLRVTSMASFDGKGYADRKFLSLYPPQPTVTCFPLASLAWGMGFPSQELPMAARTSQVSWLLADCSPISFSCSHMRPHTRVHTWPTWTSCTYPGPVKLCTPHLDRQTFWEHKRDPWYHHIRCC